MENRPLGPVFLKATEEEVHMALDNSIETYLKNTEKIKELNFSDLRSLWTLSLKKDCLTGFSPWTNTTQTADGTSEQLLRNQLNELKKSVKDQIDSNLLWREILLSIGFLSFYILLITWVLISCNWNYLPYCLIFGPILLWIIARWSNRHLWGGWQRSMSLLPAPTGIITLPIIALIFFILFFLIPKQFGIQSFALAIVEKNATLTLNCNSNISVGKQLSPGMTVNIETERPSNSSCVRISTNDGRVGFIPADSIQIQESDTLKLLQSTTIWLFVLTIILYISGYVLQHYYTITIVPKLLEKHAAKQQELLHKKMEEADFLEKYKDNGLGMETDLQEAKTKLTEKITKRHDDQVRKILESKTLTPKEKNEMVQQITNWTLEALS
ncbi:hypothetical protein JWG39_02775 [Desulforhopalus vacuolatus]|uniref:hypothetical protein n=1 Tax=Desulforhopalus vacuolatus TaxID=40414 RepID=UPI0019665F2D|nr:hypothetical protein [Desulforhopalus vacuolatus]MBM9518742.1 hypothetical protein [Desulforhopalus vacuolatus]